MSDGFTIEGNSSNVVARLDSIDERVASRLASAMQALESELIGEIKARTPVRSGALVASIQGRVAAGPTGAIAEITANPTGGMSKGSRAAYYALFNEYGTKERFHKRPPAGGEAPRSLGKIEAKHFMHGPFDEAKPRIKEAIAAAVNDGV